MLTEKLTSSPGRDTLASMIKNERGSAFVVVLLLLLLAVGFGAAFCTQFETTRETPREYTQREADILCNTALFDARRALWYYQTTRPGKWDKILADLQGESIDPKLHQREYVDRVEELIEDAEGELSQVEHSPKSPEENLKTVQKAIHDLAAAKGMAGRVNSRWTDAVVRACDLDSAIRSSLNGETRKTENRRFILEKIEERSRNRLRHFGAQTSSYFGEILPAGGRAVIIVVRDNEDGDDDPRKDRDGKIYVWVTALLPNGVISQTESLVEYDPRAEDHAVVLVKSRKLQ